MRSLEIYSCKNYWSEHVKSIFISHWSITFICILLRSFAAKINWLAIRVSPLIILILELWSITIIRVIINTKENLSHLCSRRLSFRNLSILKGRCRKGKENIKQIMGKIRRIWGVPLEECISHLSLSKVKKNCFRKSKIIGPWIIYQKRILKIKISQESLFNKLWRLVNSNFYSKVMCMNLLLQNQLNFQEDSLNRLSTFSQIWSNWAVC